ncbi:MAG: hypothetical protein KGY45_03880 [Hadesarchaea archaeon]|nr:hypothetical protein [Hadesarchaea archaeon]
MKKKALGIGLTLLTIALWVGPIVTAFSANNWNLKSTLMPRQEELQGVKNKFGGVMDEGISEDMFSTENAKVNLSDNEFEVDANLSSPFNIPITIQGFSGKLVDQDYEVIIADIQMDEENVYLPPNGEAQFTIIGTLTQSGSQHIENNYGGEVPPNIRPINLTVELEFYGVLVNVSFSEMSTSGGE